MNTEKEADRLSARGFDGLYHPTEPCGCWLDDLRPCGEERTGCLGGHESGDGSGIYKPVGKRSPRP
jgi:hypothetical protein